MCGARWIVHFGFHMHATCFWLNSGGCVFAIRANVGASRLSFRRALLITASALGRG